MGEGTATQSPVAPEQLLGSQVAALEQLLEVYEQAVLEQSERLEAAQGELARQVLELRREIAERRQAQENLRRSERLASIGTLAAGLAHEINNPLGLIALEVHRASRHAGEPETLESALQEIDSHVRRCAQIVRSVLQFSREEPTQKWSVDVNEIAAHTRDLTREKARRNEIVLELELARSLPRLLLNPTEMEQVFVNLISNAIDASPTGARVVVATAHGDGWVRASVSDHGCGMTEHDVDRAFDPFYTTRSRQGGTGLGLSTCHGIVTDLGGDIEIDSAEGRGTTVTVSLPVEPEREGGE